MDDFRLGFVLRDPEKEIGVSAQRIGEMPG
jgi:hypothetical protein